MKRNMGNADRLARTLVAAALAALYFYGNIPAPWSYISLAVGTIFLITAIVGNCPLYSLFGIKTCRTGNSNKPI